VVSFLVSGTIFFTFVENWSVLDAFYISATTLTTVGLAQVRWRRRAVLARWRRRAADRLLPDPVALDRKQAQQAS
jgi:Ion channel